MKKSLGAPSCCVFRRRAGPSFSSQSIEWSWTNQRVENRQTLTPMDRHTSELTQKLSSPGDLVFVDGCSQAWRGQWRTEQGRLCRSDPALHHLGHTHSPELTVLLIVTSSGPVSLSSRELLTPRSLPLSRTHWGYCICYGYADFFLSS